MSDDNKKQQLGKILLKQKLIQPEDLDQLLAGQKGDKKRLASKALEQGLVDELRLLKALSEQHGMPATNLEEAEILLTNLNIIPQDIARKHTVLPVAIDADTIHLAMASPDDRRVIDEIEFVTGKRVFPHVALQKQLTTCIDECYKAKSAGKKVYRGKRFGQPRPNVPPSVPPPPPPQAGEPGTEGTVLPDSIESSSASIDIDIPVDDLSSIHPVEPVLSNPPQTASTTGGTGPTVLVVDDEDDIRLLISRVLTDKGYNVVTASRGLEAIQKVQATTPDMIILDAMLPELHGFDICKKIKGSSKYGHIPVIMISAIYRGWRYAQDLKDSYGVDEFIEKPFKIGELLEKVESYASRTKKEEDAPKGQDLSKEAEKTLAAGIDAYRNGDIDAAIDLLKKGIGIDPLAFKLHYHLALLLGKKGLNYQAIRALENTLELAPEYFPALKNLAVLYQKAGFKFKAVETWERAIGFSPDEKTREGIKNHLMSLL
jgi:DNA-binding response OmpR family regulator